VAELSLSPADWTTFKLYLGIELRESDELRAARSSLCSTLGLTPRAESHVTIAYVGQVTEAELEELSTELSPLMGDDLASFQLAGTGAAFEATAGCPELLNPLDLTRASTLACVAWWSIELTPGLARLRAAASSMLERWGRGFPANEPYRPHVTLGSRGRADIADEDFDIFTLEKVPTLRAFSAPERVCSARVHFTATKLLPRSVTCLRTW
jgi:2'-5' RNA ligase